jgi:hypothetical protein
MKNRYFVKTRGHVEKFGVDKTDERHIESACSWTEDKLLAALKQLDEKAGVTNLRIVEFRRDAHPHSNAFDLDKALGI